MKKLLAPLCLVLLFAQASYSQSSSIPSGSSSQVWMSMAEKELTFNSFYKTFKEEMALERPSSLEVIKDWTDGLGMRHVRALQLIEDVPVEGAVLLLHGRDNTVEHFNGLFVNGDFASSVPSISKQEAFSKMREYYGPYRLYYENPGMEAMIKEVESDDNATFRPEGELMYTNELFSKDASKYKLAWKFDVYVEKEIDREHIYIDAQTGQILFTRQACSSGCAVHDDHEGHGKLTRGMAVVADPNIGRGITRYIGEVPITTDSLNDSTYILFDRSRGEGVRTYDMNNRTDASLAEDFVNDTNFWDLRNPARNEAAIDAHYGAQKTYDYWQESFGWSSWDGSGGLMRSYVHWDAGWFNASWNGRFARFGDGRGDPLTHIDVVAHEFTHGLVDATADLVYRDESGALNESFADIFGNAVENYALEDTSDWFIGVESFTFRNMANPGQYGDPDTYLGNNWHTASSDNGGVHVNSGVQNFWYYLLVNGGSGTNDHGLDYTVDSLGWEKASAIAFRNLSTYLTQSSQYYDARLGALQAAADLYGECSPEVLAVSQAWAAVGLGTLEPTHDLQVLSAVQIESSCDLSDAEELSMTFRFNPSGCGYQLDSGKVITVGYKLDNGTQIVETLELERDVAEGEIFSYTFEETIDLSESGRYDVDYWVSLEDDAYAANDTLFEQIIMKPVQYENDRKITFRNFSSTRDSFFVRTGDNAKAELFVSGSNPRPGLLAFSMTGNDDDLDDVNLPPVEAGNFIANPDYGSSICFCVDLTDWKNFILEFDMRQTYSNAYLVNYGSDLPELASSMRITVDGNQVGDQYHPETYFEDPWETYSEDLSEFIGTKVELCFEGKHFLDRQGDQEAGGSSRGDYTYLDNITFSGKTSVSSLDLAEIPIRLVPNPAYEQLRVKANITGSQNVQLTVMDVAGRQMLNERLRAEGVVDHEVNVASWKPGVYTLIMQSNQFRTIRRIVVE